MALDWQRVEEGVAGAEAATAAERDEWIDKFCDGDDALRREIESLLSFSLRDGLLDTPIDGRLVSELIAEPQPHRTTEFGNYRVIREIGRGGMGIVFLAERSDGEFDQRVALKIVRQSIADSQIIDRFRRERQILAGLEHPNIARLLDGGITADGEPFLAMEYVDGVPLTEYIENSRLTTQQTLELFLKVCSALAYAHRNLVVHRDIKPANILVNRSGDPKLLDFGLAKLVADGFANTDQTQTAFRALTPAYASPEQMRNENLTTASDIYSLGVVFYEILANERPFRFEGKTLTEILSTVEVNEPPPPSRGSAGKLSSDLDNIALMALRSDPDKRYATIEAFADDIERHLNGLPVTARPNTLRYRAAKFAKRHRFGIGAAAMVLAVLVIGLMATVWQGRAAARERDQARQAQARAEQLNTFLQEILSSASPEEKGKDAKVLDILKDALLGLDTRFADQPELKAQALLTIGQTYSALDLTDESIPALRRALELNSALYGNDSPVTAVCRAYLAQALLDRANVEEAESLLTDSISVFERAGGDSKDFAFALHVLGELYVRQKKFEQAGPLLHRSIEMSDRMLGPNNPNSAFALISLGRAHNFKGDLDAAEGNYRRSVEIYRQLPERYSVRLAIVQINLGGLLVSRGKLDEAIRELRESDAIIAQKQGDSFVRFESKYYLSGAHFAANDMENAITEGSAAIAIARRLGLKSAMDYAPALEYLGAAMTKRGQASAAEPFLREAVEIKAGRTPANASSLAIAKGWLGDCLLEQGRYSEAEPLLVERLTTLREANTPSDQPKLQTARSQLFILYTRWKKPELADRYRSAR